MALTDNLEAYLELSDLNDAHGANHLTNNNAATFVAGHVGNAVQLVRASEQSLNVADNPPLSAGNIDWSAAAWVKLASKPAGPMTVIAKYLTAGNNREYQLFWNNSDDRFHFNLSRDGTVTNLTPLTATSFGAPALDTWYFIVIWHDSVNDTINIQINNGAIDSVANVGGFDGASPFEIGCHSSGADLWDGLIDQVGLWKRVLTAQERTDLYNSGAGLSYAALLALEQEPAATPTIDPNGGTFEESVQVTLDSDTPDATIFYTVDGSDPDDGSTEYIGPFTLTESVTVKAIAFAPGFTPSEIVSASFTITDPPPEPEPEPDGGEALLNPTVTNKTRKELRNTTDNPHGSSRSIMVLGSAYTREDRVVQRRIEVNYSPVEHELAIIASDGDVPEVDFETFEAWMARGRHEGHFISRLGNISWLQGRLKGTAEVYFCQQDNRLVVDVRPVG